MVFPAFLQKNVSSCYRAEKSLPFHCTNNKPKHCCLTKPPISENLRESLLVSLFAQSKRAAGVFIYQPYFAIVNTM